LLGLLALQPWTTYELAKQAGRSLRWFWPRAERKLYDEPKKLVAMGYATAGRRNTGRRAGTVYTITPAGRAALAEWLRGEGKPPVFELEEVIRVFFADQGDLGQLRATLERIETQTADAQRALAAIVRDAGDDAVYGDRGAVNALAIRLVADLHRTTAAWAQWAQGEVAAWESTKERWPEAPAIFAAVLADGDAAEPEG
jgi:DNA-binding PadR family transcriptional regulator